MDKEVKQVKVNQWDLAFTIFVSVLLANIVTIVAVFLYMKSSFVETDKVRMALIVIAVASLFMALYLASGDQYRALHENLKVS